MQFNPETLETFADGVQEDLAANILREFSKAWNADRKQIDDLQRENTELQRTAASFAQLAREAKQSTANTLRETLAKLDEAA